MYRWAVLKLACPAIRIAVLATDLPLHPGQLRRLARRIDIGLGRTGSVGNDGSGEIFIAFSIANRIPRSTPHAAQSRSRCDRGSCV
jgi:L-aminopeptidase/D-esterase-like protein